MNVWEKTAGTMTNGEKHKKHYVSVHFKAFIQQQEQLETRNVERDKIVHQPLTLISHMKYMEIELNP